MIAKCALFTFALCCFSAYAANTVSQDLDALRAMTTWNITQPAGPVTPEQSCGILDIHRYDRTLLQHQVGSDIEDRRATQRMTMLEDKVVHLLQQRHWTGMNGNLCYGKQQVIVHAFKTSSRCKQSAPCTAYDGVSVLIYLPRTK